MGVEIKQPRILLLIIFTSLLYNAIVVYAKTKLNRPIGNQQLLMLGEGWGC